ncbi:Ig-like domain, partial [Halomonas sp. DQ26W]|uniref:retention module-containing protein n=1 Tax=Halomonas sp. DQ26W TaxID=2282311 RepID=UPI000DF85658
MSIATVVSISGQAWARDADGNMRELRVGDTLVEGESLITSDNGRVELDFADSLDPTVIEGGQVVAMTPELDADLPVDMGEFSALDEDLEALLAALEDDDVDLLDVLDATAAGAGPGGGADGGHTFVQLARIAENVDPLAFEFGEDEFEESPEIEGAGLLVAEAEEEPELITEPDPLPPGSITVSIDNINSENVTQVPITGTTSNVPVGSTITIVVTDQEGNTATTEATVNPDGSYQAEIDLTDLVDGPVSVDASVVDQAGETQTADDDAVKDTFAEASITIDTIAGDDVINGEEATQTITITGTVGGDAREGDTVTLTVGGQEFTGLVGEDLTYAIDVPGSLLADNDSVNAEVTGSDDAGNPYSADADRSYDVDTTAPTVTVTLGDDGAPLAEGEETTITIDFSEVAYGTDG